MKFYLLTFSLIIFSRGSAFADPLRPGGDLTHEDTTKTAFNRPGPNLGEEISGQFGTGNAIFKTNWVFAGSGTTGLDGLGPTYNARSCSACHLLDGRGAGYEGDPGLEKVHLSLLFRLSHKTSSGAIEAHPNYGEQLNPIALPTVPAEAQVEVTFEAVNGQFADGTPYQLRRPKFTFKDFAFGEFDNDTLFSPRVANQLVGMGLIDAIAAQDILALADPNDEDNNGISGKANYVNDVYTNQLALGRFGWKSNQPSLKQQNAAAFLGDLGLTSRLFPNENCPLIQVDCANAFVGDDVDVADHFMDFLNVYTQAFGVPPRRKPKAPEVLAGEKTFYKIGCANCHQPGFTTSNDYVLEPLRNQAIYPYSDFLVHDMGEDLADHRPDGLADGREWRTAPLWGVGLIPAVSGHQNLLHDARARGVEEAILWHGGEAAKSREDYKKLIVLERKNVVMFVNSL